MHMSDDWELPSWTDDVRECLSDHLPAKAIAIVHPK